MSNSLTRISFRVKPAERTCIVSAARAAGVSVGTYVRSRLLDRSLTGATYRRSQMQRSVRHLIGQIGRVGNNMNQIAAKLNSGQDATVLDRQRHEEGIAALIHMRAALIGHFLQPRC